MTLLFLDWRAAQFVYHNRDSLMLVPTWQEQRAKTIISGSLTRWHRLGLLERFDRSFGRKWPRTAFQNPIARQIANEETESSQELMTTVIKTSPLSRENVEMVVDQLIPRFEQRITNLINYHLEKYQWHESELDRLAKKLVPLLQERVLTSNAAGGAGPKPPVPFAPGIAGDHPLEDEREGRQRYSRWEREIVSDRRHGLGTDEQLPPRYPMDREEARANRFPIDIVVAEMGPYEPHLTERSYEKEYSNVHCPIGRRSELPVPASR